MSSKTEKKDKILNTRISEALHQELIDQSNKLKIPVSNLVRNILEDAVKFVGELSGNVENLVGDFVYDVQQFRKGTLSREKNVMPDPLGHIFGWQELRLNKPFPCLKCAQPLKMGELAYLALSDSKNKEKQFLCQACIKAIEDPASAENMEHWSKILANQKKNCQECQSEINKGKELYFRDETGEPQFLCSLCYQQKQNKGDHHG
jgi:hypothetical protein